MHRRLYRYWYIIPLLLLALLVRDWVEEPVIESVEDTIDMTATKADYYLEDFETLKLDTKGRPEYIIHGDSLIHYPAEDVSEIVAPHLILHRGEASWTVESKMGRLTTDPDIFTLQGAVTVHRSATSEIAEIKITTTDLRVHTAENFIQTDKPIEIISQDWTLKSKGFESHIEAGKLTFLSEVEGHYEVVN